MPPARSKARKRALDILFEAEQRGSPVLDLLAERITLGSPPVPGYAADLVRGVAVHTARIDELISQYAEGWTMDRMPAVDRNVLRIGGPVLLQSLVIDVCVCRHRRQRHRQHCCPSL